MSDGPSISKEELGMTMSSCISKMKPALSQISFLIFAASGYAMSDRKRTTFLDPVEFSRQKFDFLIIGGGTAGLVVASRLSEVSSLRIGVLEAGEYLSNDPLIGVPVNYGRAFGNPKYDWLYTSTPQPGLNGRVVNETVGKVLGGSSAICDVLWQRGSATEYNVWGNDLGNGDSWSFDALLRYFRKAENWTEPPLVLPGQKFSSPLHNTHGKHGPVQVGYNNFFPQPIKPSVAAANALGIQTNSNPDSGNSTGYQTPARAVDNRSGTRSYSVSAYLEPYFKRQNLHVLTGALVSKINFRTAGTAVIATGVEYIVHGKRYSVTARKEVILSAGSLGTPRILEHSGIGNKKLLNQLKIPVVFDLPQVGENLMDQTYLALDYVTKHDVSTLDQLRINTSYLEEQQILYEKLHIGPLTYDTSAVATTPLHKVISSADLANLATLLDATISNPNNTRLQNVQYKTLKTLLLKGEIGWLEFLLLPAGGVASSPLQNTSYVTPFVFHLWPLSRGSVHIQSIDPASPPLIDPQYLSNPFDSAVHALAAKWIRRWMATSPMSDLIEKPNVPPVNVQEIEDFENYAREAVSTTFHPIGTTALAPKSLGGVVDPLLRVYGVPNLRIVDAGVIPLTFGVAPLATVYAIAEKGADIIKNSLARVQT